MPQKGNTTHLADKLCDIQHILQQNLLNSLIYTYLCTITNKDGPLRRRKKSADLSFVEQKNNMLSFSISSLRPGISKEGSFSISESIMLFAYHLFTKLKIYLLFFFFILPSNIERLCFHCFLLS